MKQKRMKLRMAALMAVLLIRVLTVPVFAETNDPIEVVNDLSDFMFGLVRAVGMVMLGFAEVQIGLSRKSHDPSQRANGFLALAGGGVIIVLACIIYLLFAASPLTQFYKNRHRIVFASGGDLCFNRS